jgi:hypothetical protein
VTLRRTEGEEKMESDKWIWYILVSAGMKFGHKKMFWYGIPAYTGPLQALHATEKYPTFAPFNSLSSIMPTTQPHKPLGWQ